VHARAPSNKDRVFAALVDHLQAELDDARREGAGDLTSICVQSSTVDVVKGNAAANPVYTAGRALGSTDDSADVSGAVPGQIQIGVIEGIVELGAELNLQALDGRIEVLVERNVSLVQGWRAARIAAGVAERAKHIARGILDRGKNEGRQVDVVDVARVGCAVRTPLGYRLARNLIGAILVGAAVGRAHRDLRREGLAGVWVVGEIKGRARLYGVDRAYLPASNNGVDDGVSAGE